MSQQITKIKGRIKTVTSALKVTSAMKLVSTVKLNRYKNTMMANREFSKRIDDISTDILKWTKVKTQYSVEPKDINKKLFIVVSSTLGLCGSYNANIFKLIDSSISEEDELIVLGKKGLTHFKNNQEQLILNFSNYHSIKDEKIINQITNFVTGEFLKGKYKEIHLIYSHYHNSLIFTPKDHLILPLKEEKEVDELAFKPILEPNEKTLLNTIIPMYLKTTIYSKLLESEVCEQSARCNAMESATDNANEILEALNIEFNKARQAAITQEITEIVGAAEAL